MHPFSYFQRILILIAIIVFSWSVSGFSAEPEDSISIANLRPDNACGPRCLWALMRDSHRGMVDCDINYIYRTLNIEPMRATSMADLKRAAEIFGFIAEGRKLRIQDLPGIRGYMILPLGRTKGTPENPLHFVLVKKVTDHSAIIVNTRTLNPQSLSIAELQTQWNGYALVITPGKGMAAFESSSASCSAEECKQVKYDGRKDFGVVESGSELKHSFVIMDVHGEKDTARIVDKNCSCISAAIGQNAKGEHILTMRLRMDRPGPQLARVTVLLESAGILKRYVIEAYGKDTFQITPALGYIEAQDRTVIKYPVSIDYFTDDKSMVSFDHLEADDPTIKTASVRSTPKPIKKGGKVMRFDVELAVDVRKETGGTKVKKVDFVIDTPSGKKFIPLSIELHCNFAAP